VTQVNAYLRQPTSGLSGRRFQIHRTAGAAQPGAAAQLRDEDSGGYTVGPNCGSSDSATLICIPARSLATRNQEILDRKKGLGDHAQRARRSTIRSKTNFRNWPPSRSSRRWNRVSTINPANAQQALLAGFVLTPYFAGSWRCNEKQERRCRLYYPEMAAYRSGEEDARLSKVEFAREAVRHT